MSEATNPRTHLTRAYEAAIRAVAAPAALARHVEYEHDGLRICGRNVAPETRLFVLAAGKAAAAMAEAFEGLVGDRIHAGLVITKDGHADGYALDRFEVRESAHPVPDARSEACADAALAFVRETEPDDLLVVLLSGGASALLSAPVSALTIEDLSAVNACLLASGTDIEQVNCVRKHLSRISGGRLALACGAGRIEVLAISDVPGDRPDVIASGPFTGDPSRFSDAVAVLARGDAKRPIPQDVLNYLREGAAGQHPETPKPGDPGLRRVHFEVVANNEDARRAAAASLVGAGVAAELDVMPLAGEAREAAESIVDRALALAGPGARVLVAGGETTVRLRGDGLGGRNQELALAAALAIARRLASQSEREVVLLAAGTDGTDGPTLAAGAWADRGTVERAEALGQSAQSCLEANDSFHLFEAEGGLFITGPSGTNVMDLVLIWVGPSSDPRAGLIA